MDAAIISLGIANPPFKRKQMETAQLISESISLRPAEKKILKSVYRATGIETRYSVLSDYEKNQGELDFFPNDSEAIYPSTAARMQVYKQNALKIALLAIENTFLNLPKFNKQSITHLITVSCTGMYAPGLDIELVNALELDSSVKRTCINFMGCYGTFNALKVAESICKADLSACVLIVSVEICTIHFQKNMSLDNIIANAIFADGAGAMIISASENYQKRFKLKHFYCDLLPNSNKEMAWNIADFGFDIVLSSYVPDVIKKGIPHFIKKFERQIDFKMDTIDYYAIHPGGLKILQACEDALKITSDQNKYAYSILKYFGNMSSATIIFVLKAIWDDIGKKDFAKTIFACAFGPGLTLESLLLEIQG